MTVDPLTTAPRRPVEALGDIGWPHRVGVPARLRTSRWTIVALLTLLTLVSALLRTRQLSLYYWVDEGISVGISSHHLSQLPSLLRQDGSPPLFYVLLHAWMQVWGRTETATHALSLIFALAAVPVAYWAAASVFDRRTGTYCAILAAGLPFLTTYAQETRMYSIVLLESIVVAASFLHAFVHGRRRFLPAFVAALTATLYTHNWGLFLGLGCFVSFLVLVGLTADDRPRLIRDGLLSFAAVAVLYLPWVATLLYQARYTGAPWALPPDLWSLTQGMYFLVGGRGAAVALLLAAGSGLAAIRAGAGAERSTRTMAILLLVLALTTLAVAWLYAKLSPSWSPRYLAAVVGPLLLLAALGLRRAGRLGLVALVLVCCFWVLDPVLATRDEKSSVASAAKAIAPRLGINPLVLSTQPEQVPTLAYYLPRVTRFATPLGPVADPRVVNWRDALTRFRQSSPQTVLAPLTRSLRRGQRVALVVPMHEAKTPLWARLIHRSSLAWAAYLRRDRHLRLLTVASPGANGSLLPVRVSLFVVRGPAGRSGAP
jgi:mannosyltransferase